MPDHDDRSRVAHGARHDGHDRTPCEARSRGFTLVEAVIAAALAVTTIGIALPVLRVVQQSVALGAEQSTAAMLAASRLEELCALAWRFDTPFPGVEVRVSDHTTDLSVTPAGATGTGLQPSPSDALRTNRAGHVDFLDGRGHWLGAGLSPPPGTVYVRRWSVTPWPPAAADVLVVQVMVGALAVEPGAAGRQGFERRPGDAWLLSVRTRGRR
jgi:type II secretory pathway pseudopilin PulG